MEIRSASAQPRASAPTARPQAEAGPRDTVDIGSRPAAPLLMPRPAAQPIPGYDTSWLDTTVRPQDDFYRYSLGGYEATHPIPADKASYGIRTELNERISAELKGLCEEAAANPQTDLDRKVGNLYASGMDLAAIEARGTAPLQPYLAALDGIQNTADLQKAIGTMHKQGLGALFSFYGTPDKTDPNVNIAEVRQGGLSLPDRDFYLNPKKQGIRDKFEAHVGRMFELAGETPARASEMAKSVLSLETRIALGHLTKVQLRDPHATYNPSTTRQLQELAPQIDWSAYFAGQAANVEKLNISTIPHFHNIGRLVSEAPLDDWKSYLKWQTLNQMGGLLPDRFGAEQFEFTGKTLNGIPERAPRHKRIMGLVDNYLGEALGQKFVAKNFPPEAKEKALAMVNNVKDVFRERISTGWMSEETKKAALEKIDTMAVQIGYPDQWHDYSGLEMTRDGFFENVMNAKAHYRAESMAEIGQPVDKNEWSTTPQTVNAFYSPLFNRICFPAARLQPPFFDVNQDDAYNLGATGATVGHEMTHGFDDKGCNYDAQGKLRNWWTDADRQKFDGIAGGIISQMNEFWFDGQQNNGKLVAGEAIADQGGLELAYGALQKSLAKDGAPESKDGFTPEQRFFLSYALCRQGAARPEAAHNQMTTDPHPLAPFRVNGPLANMTSFHDAFQVKEGDPMLRPVEKRNKLWDP